VSVSISTKGRKELEKAKEFFGKLGFNFNAQFSDDAPSAGYSSPLCFAKSALGRLDSQRAARTFSSL